MRKSSPEFTFYSFMAISIIISITVVKSFDTDIQNLAFLFLVPIFATICAIVAAAIVSGWVSGAAKMPAGLELVVVCAFVIASSGCLLGSLATAHQITWFSPVNGGVPILEFWSYGLGALFACSAIIVFFQTARTR